MMPIKRAPRKHHFTIIPNDALEDTRLSFKARGLLAYMLSKSDDWEFYERELITHTPDGRDAVRSALRELSSAGYLVREQAKNTSGTFDKSQWLVFDTSQLPMTEKPSTVATPQPWETVPELQTKKEPLTEKPSPDKPSPDNPPLPSTDLTKDLLNQDTTTTTSSDPLKPVQQFWESNGFGSMTQYLWQDFEKWLADFKKLGATQENAVELIIKALQSCVEAGPDKRNQRYMRGILNRYANSRYTSVADVEADEKARKDAQQATSKRSGKPRNKPYTNDVWKDVVTGDPFADDDDYSQPVRKTSKRDAYHDHRLDDDFRKAEELAASNGSQGPTDPFSDSLPY